MIPEGQCASDALPATMSTHSVANNCRKVGCQTEMGEQIAPEIIEPAHRLARFQEGKNRRVIIRFVKFKDMGSIVWLGVKLKGTSVAIREDFSPDVRLAWFKLVHHPKTLNRSFKLRYDKLLVDNKCYVYDDTQYTVDEMKISKRGGALKAMCSAKDVLFIQFQCSPF